MIEDVKIANQQIIKYLTGAAKLDRPVCLTVVVGNQVTVFGYGSDIDILVGDRIAAQIGRWQAVDISCLAMLACRHPLLSTWVCANADTVDELRYGDFFRIATLPLCRIWESHLLRQAVKVDSVYAGYLADLLSAAIAGTDSRNPELIQAARLSPLGSDEYAYFGQTAMTVLACHLNVSCALVKGAMDGIVTVLDTGNDRTGLAAAMDEIVTEYGPVEPDPVLYARMANRLSRFFPGLPDKYRDRDDSDPPVEIVHSGKFNGPVWRFR